MNPNTSTKTGTILVIDDETAVTGAIKAILSKDGYQVYTAHTGTEGITLASEVKPSLIILDITMPDLDGYEVAEQIHQNPATKETPIIFLTGKSASEDGGKAFAKGGVSFVCKPFTGKQLRDLVTLAMQSLEE